MCKCSSAAATLERFSTADSKASSPHKPMLISMTTLCEIIIVPWFGATELTEWFSSCYYCEMSHANSWRYTGQWKCESDETFLLYDTWKNVLASKNTFAHLHMCTFNIYLLYDAVLDVDICFLGEVVIDHLSPLDEYTHGPHVSSHSPTR